MKILKMLLTLLNVSVTVAFIHFEDRLTGFSLIFALFLFSLSSIIHLFAHECGHFIGGMVSGYKLLCLQIGPIQIVIDQNNKPIISLNLSLSGQCVMLPKHVENVRFKSYNMGGIYANVVVMILSFLLLLMNSFGTSLLFIQLISIGMKKVIINTIPHKTNSIPNDAYIVKILKNNKATQKDYAMYLKLYSMLFWNTDISPQDFMYDREKSENNDEMLYYNEIQDILNSLPSTKNTGYSASAE